MKNKQFVLNTVLAGVVGLALLAIVLMRTFLPQYIVPKAGVPAIALLSLIALVIEKYITGGAPRCYICVPVFSALTFGLLPWAAGYIPADMIWKTALIGAAVFTILTWAYGSICERISSGPSAKAAPVVSAVGLYFAVQCLTGLFF